MRHTLAQGTPLPTSIESGVSLRNSLVPNSTTLYKIKLSECYGVFATVIPVESLSVSHAYDEGDFGSTRASLLCCLATRQSIWATLVTKSRLFRLLSLQPNYPQAFPPDVTSYPILWLLHLPRLPRAADITQDTNPRCRKAPTPPTRLHSVLVAPVFMDFLNCETICYLMWMELLIFLGYFLLVCLLKKGDAPAGFVRRGCAFCFVVVLSCSCWSCYFNWVVAIKS